MAAYTERMERFENAIFKQREEINDRMTEMFGLLKELTTSRAPEKVLIREEAKFPVTKNVNSISLTRGGEEMSEKINVTTRDDFKNPTKTETEMPFKEAKKEDEAENEPNRNTQPTQVKKITTSCEICSGPHDTQYCMEDPEQAFVEYASSRTDEAEVSYARSYPIMDPQCSTQIHSSINAITIHPKQQSDSHDRTEENEEEERGSPENHPDSPTPPDPSISFITEKVLKFNSLFESLGLVPPSPNAELVCTKEEDGDVMFIKIIPKDDNSHKEEPKEGVQEVEYFDIFSTRSELAYNKYLMCGPIPPIFLRNPIIIEGCPSNLKIPCNIRHVHMEKAYIYLNSPLNIMTRMMYNWIMRRKLDPRENPNRGVIFDEKKLGSS
ncbi:hypothetical protein Tco_0771137 [Tanacetum coccineum]|uniref:MAK10-like protein n=1 Tax=Tanacetum coccineum TaxID=301880 RepID=A0ABQ4ZGS9_9ASTR